MELPGRSINIEDIDEVSSFVASSYTENTPSKRYYPIIFASEEVGNINNNGYGAGDYGLGSSMGKALGRSEQSSYITQSTARSATTLRGIYASNAYKISTNYMAEEYVELFSYQPATTTALNGYWLASRYAYLNGTYGSFSIYLIRESAITDESLYVSDNTTYSKTFSVRPVVSITLETVNVGETGDGLSADTAFSVKKK